MELSGQTRRSRGRCALVAALGAAVLLFNFGRRLLLTNDDTRFPVLARDILDTGHWLLPTLPDGVPHLMKPPLVVWLTALASLPSGSVGVRSAVLPSVLEAIGVVILTCWIGRSLFGPDAGAVAGLTVATTVGVYTMAHSSMPDMAQLLAATGALAVYVTSEFGERRSRLVAFYGVIGVGMLAKGAAGLIPLAIVIADTLVTWGARGLSRLVSIPGWMLLAALAAPWWIIAASSAGRSRFVHAVVMNDQLVSYFWRPVWGWRTLVEPFVHAATVVLPWGILLPLAAWRARREANPDSRRRVRFLLLWLVVAFALVAASGRQRDRYYLVPCVATALLVGWWYSVAAWRWRAWAFGAAWIAVGIVGARLVVADTRRHNAETDLTELRAVLAGVSAPVSSFDLQDLALSFNLERPVVNDKNARRFEERARKGETGFLIISDRALANQALDPCIRRVAAGRVTRRPFSVLDSTQCARR